MEELKMIPRDQLVLHENIRKNVTPESLAELVESIKVDGIITPLTARAVNSHFEVIAGQRRFLASELAGLNELPCMVKDIDDVDVERIQTIENIQRADLTPMDEARAYAKLLDYYPNAEQIALTVSKSRNYVLSRLRLVDLIEEFQQLAAESRLYFEDAKLICVLSPESQEKLYKAHRIGKEGQFHLDEWAYNKLRGDLTQAAFRLDDETLVADDNKDPELHAGSCIGCQFNSAVNTALFPEDAEEKYCLSIPCFQHKTMEHYQRAIKKAKETEGVLFVSTSYYNSDQEVAKIEKDYDVKIIPYSKYETPSGDEKKLTTEEKEKKGWRKGFVVIGDNIGKLIWVKLSKETVKKSSSAARDKVKEGTATKSDFQSMIEGVKKRQERAIELDFEKVTMTIREAVKSKEGEKAMAEVRRFTKLERAAFYYHMYHQLDSDEVKNLKVKGADLEDLNKAIEAFIDLDSAEADTILRTWLYGQVTNQNYCIRDTDHEAYVVRIIAAASKAADVEAIQKASDEEAAARLGRVTDRIAGLKKKQKEVDK